MPLRSKRAVVPGTILWGYWANTICLGGGVCLFLSALISFHPIFANPKEEDPSTDAYWTFTGPWALIVSLLIMVVEYPISKRRPELKNVRRREEERPYQLELRLVHLVYYSKVFKHYITRFAIYTVLVAPLIVSFPCLLSVIFIFAGNCLYFFAYMYAGEQWYPGWAVAKKKVLAELADSRPAQPPPRRAGGDVIANPAARG